MRISRLSTALALSALGAAGLASCSSGSSPAPAAADNAPTSPVAQSAAVRHKPAPTCPLTGLAPKHPADLKRATLAVKIDNIAPALPQAGLNSADMVVEEEVEGGLTRLFAVFQCSQASTVGPIRSARTTDAKLLALFHGSVFGFSGDNPMVLPAIDKYGHTQLVSPDDAASAFHIDSSRVAPHDLFSSTQTLLRTGEALHKGKIAPPPAIWSYGPFAAHARKAHVASMSWPSAAATWTWDGHQWLRTQDGAPDSLTSGQRISATNVVVMAVKLAATGIRDVAGNPSPDDVVVGKGHAWVLRNGSYVSGTWTRPSVTKPWVLRDKHGNVIHLAPGRTWVELLPDPSSFHTSPH